MTLGVVEMGKTSKFSYAKKCCIDNVMHLVKKLEQFGKKIDLCVHVNELN